MARRQLHAREPLLDRKPGAPPFRVGSDDVKCGFRAGLKIKWYGVQFTLLLHGRWEMTPEQLQKFYERLYFWEIERQHKISNRVTVFLILILSMVGFYSYLIDHLLPLEKTTFEITAGILLCVSVACLFIAAIYVKFAWHGQKYRSIPAADRMEDHRKEIIKYYKDEAIPDSGFRSSNDEFGADMFDYFVENGSTNYRINNLRSERFYLAFNWMLGSIATGVISFAILKLKDGIWASCP
jgi:hypothetical protein